MIESIFFTNYLLHSLLFFNYIGPGMGGGVIAAIIGLIAAFFIGLWGILYYPIKRFLRNKKKRKKTKNTSK